MKQVMIRLAYPSGFLFERGYEVGSLAVTPDRETNQRHMWTITHLKSGQRLGSASFPRLEAIAKAKALNTLGVPWDLYVEGRKTEVAEEIRAQIRSILGEG